MPPAWVPLVGVQAKEEALSTLRSVLAIGEDAHLRMRKEIQDEAAGSRNGPQPSPPVPGPSVGHSQPAGPAEGLRGGGSARLASPYDSAFDGSGAAADAGGAGSRVAAGSKRNQAQQQGAGEAGAAARKRVKQEGSAAGARRPASRQRAPTPPQPAQAQAAGAPVGGVGEINPLIGRKVERNWPAQGGWFEGVISDYRAETGEHWCAGCSSRLGCVLFNITWAVHGVLPPLHIPPVGLGLVASSVCADAVGGHPAPSLERHVGELSRHSLVSRSPSSASNWTTPPAPHPRLQYHL